MEEKKTIKINLSTFLLLIAIVVIIFLGVFICLQNMILNDRIDELENRKISENQSQFNDSRNMINNELHTQESENLQNLENSITYEQITDDSERLYVTSVVNNGNNTYTIQGALYESATIPNISEKQYQDLLSGKSIEIFGEQYILSEYDKTIYYGDDIIAAISPANHTSLFPTYFIQKSSNEYYSLINNSQTGILKFTRKYGEITVDENISVVTYSDDGVNLKTVLNDSSNYYYNTFLDKKAEEMKDYLIDIEGCSFMFENGKCYQIFVYPR